MSGDEIDWVFDETRKLVAEESRLRQELGLPPGPTFYEVRSMTTDELWLEATRLRKELGLLADDDPPPDSVPE